ncbi:MAG: VTT domain-containing protein [Actinomycetota bacterium]|nr:VTT domain-containing protein [Actinomycetota bacterium]
MIAFLTPFLLVLGPTAVVVAMGIVFAETGLLLGFFLPGDSLRFTIGALAAGGLLHVPFLIVVVGLFVAAVAVDQMGYAVGRRLGSKVYTRADSRVFATSHRVAAERFFERYGPKAVVLARFVPVVRTLTPVVAGVGQMPRRQFTVFNVLGALTWTAGLLTVGFYLGWIPLVATHIELFAVGVVIVSLVPATVGLVRHRSERARSACERVRRLGPEPTSNSSGNKRFRQLAKAD